MANEPTPIKKMVIDTDPQYLADVRAAAHAKYGSDHPIDFALYGPQDEVPEGMLHFQKPGELAKHVRDNKIKAIVSGVRAPKAQDESLYGFRLGLDLSKEIDQRDVQMHLHSSSYDQYDREYYKEGTKTNFSGISPKGSPEKTLRKLDDLAKKFEPPVEKKKPSNTVIAKQVKRETATINPVRFMTVNLKLDNIPPDTMVFPTSVGSNAKDYPKSLEFNAFEYLEHHVRDVIPGFTGTSKVHGILIGVNPGLSEEEAARIAHLARINNLPVVCVAGGALSHVGKQALRAEGASVVSAAHSDEAIRVATGKLAATDLPDF